MGTVKVVVGYVNRPEGQAALDRAIEESRLREGRLVVVRSLTGEEEADEFIATRDELEELEERLERVGVDFEIRELVRGKPGGEDLAEFANEEGADLVVIGLRRRTKVGKLVLGSNAHDVLMQSDCPVLAVKADEE